MNVFENRRTLRSITMRGNATTEYVAAQNSGYWGVVATLLGIVMTIGAVAADALGSGSVWGILAGAAVALAGIAQKTLAALGYIKARADVKVAAANAIVTASTTVQADFAAPSAGSMVAHTMAAEDAPVASAVTQTPSPVALAIASQIPSAPQGIQSVHSVEHGQPAAGLGAGLTVL